jgi:hypothetical protein
MSCIKNKKVKKDIVIEYPTPDGQIGYIYSFVISCKCCPKYLRRKQLWKNICNISIDTSSIEFRYYIHTDTPTRIVHCPICLKTDEESVKF